MSIFTAAAADEDGDTIKQLRAALQQARDWIAESLDRRPISAGYMVGMLTNALAAAPQPPVVEQPQGEQEPIGEAHEWGVYEHEYSRYTHCIWDARVVPVGTKLYTHPQPKREPLTEMEIIELRQLTPGTLDVQFVKFARAIERAHEIEGDA